MPTLPPDHGMFFVIAGKHTNPSAAVPASATRHTSADLALAITLQRCATRSMRLHDRCTTLCDVLRGRTWQDIEAIMPLLDDNAHEMYALKAASLAQRLAFPDKRKEMRHALNRLTSLPPEIAIPTCIALANHWQYPLEASEVAQVIVDALQAQNDLFSAIVDTLANESLRHLLRAAKSGDGRQSARSRTR